MAEHVKQNDTDPIDWVLADANKPLDLTGATVTLSVYGPAPSTALKFSAVCPVVGPGRVRQTPAAGHYDPPGDYDGEFLVDWGGGRVRRVPTGEPVGEFLNIVVHPHR